MQHKIKLNTCTAELPEPLDRELRTLVTMECDIYAVEEKDLQNGEFDKIYKAKLVGSTIVKQGDKKQILAKSKRSESVKLRLAIQSINSSDGYYERIMPILRARLEEVIEMLENT